MERLLLLMDSRPRTGSVGWLEWVLTPVLSSGHAVLLVLWPFSSSPLGPNLTVRDVTELRSCPGRFHSDPQVTFPHTGFRWPTGWGC